MTVLSHKASETRSPLPNSRFNWGEYQINSLKWKTAKIYQKNGLPTSLSIPWQRNSFRLCVPIFTIWNCVAVEARTVTEKSIVADGDCVPLAIASMEHDKNKWFTSDAVFVIRTTAVCTGGLVQSCNYYSRDSFRRFLFQLPRKIIRSGLPWIDNASSWCITLGPVSIMSNVLFPVLGSGWAAAICYLDLPLW